MDIKELAQKTMHRIDKENQDWTVISVNIPKVTKKRLQAHVGNVSRFLRTLIEEMVIDFESKTKKKK